MRRLIALTMLMMVTLSAVAATKDTGTTTLKDVQPVGVTDKKHKHQRYDLSFVVKATDLVVGSNVNYQVEGNKGKVKTWAGKQFSCTIVRVSMGAAPAH